MPTFFLAGDLMTGRGVDQILASPSAPEIHEPYVEDAREYVALAERASGPIPRGVETAYIWGDALEELRRRAPDARIVNLETSITRCDAWEDKGINYRMHPGNVGVLTAAGIDICVLANNHVLDYGPAGLEETLETLSAARRQAAGAGRTLAAARRPAVVDLRDGGRAAVFALGDASSGIPPSWAATPDGPGVDLLPDLSDATADAVGARIEAWKRRGDVAIVSIHWGSNWGYDIPAAHVRFAHRLVDRGAAVIYGHSSHHPRGIEVYRGRLVLYGCGDFLDDYEGIAGYEAFRDDLVLMYFPAVDEEGVLVELRMVPLRIHRLRLTRAAADEAAWLRATLERASAPFGSRVTLDREEHLRLQR